MNKTRPKIWLDLLILSAAVGIGCFLVLLLPSWFPDAVVVPSDAGKDTPISYNTEVQQGRLPGYESAPVNETPDYFWYLYNSAVVLSDGASPGNVLLENTTGNICDMAVTYTLATGEEIYRSPVLHPGEYLEYDHIAKVLEPGEYPVDVTILMYSPPKAEESPEDEENAEESTPGDVQDALPDADEPFATYHEKATLTIG